MAGNDPQRNNPYSPSMVKMEDGGDKKSEYMSDGEGDEGPRPSRRYANQYNHHHSQNTKNNKFEDASQDSNRNSPNHRNYNDADDIYDGKQNRSFENESGQPRRREQREVFPFRVFIKDEYLKEGISSRILIDEIIKNTGIKSIIMDKNIQVPDFPG